MKTVNLESVFEKVMLENPHMKAGRWIAIKAMREACNKAIELAAENAKLKTQSVQSFDEYIHDEFQVDKQSILNTKYQII